MSKYPVIDVDACIGCGACESACPASVFTIVDGKSTVNDATKDDCVKCGACKDACPVGAITPPSA